LRVLVGITGGIAAYKSANIVRLLTEAGHDVKALPTQNALKFIGSATLEALSHNSIDPDLYTQVADVKHIKLAQEADLIIVAPATAAFLARYASGFADDLLTNVLMATEAKIVIAPAMHTAMWEHPATQQNVQTLTNRGVLVLNPESGRLTGSDTGVGRMVEPEDIVRRSLLFAKDIDQFTGKHIVIAAGGTREMIDEVRFIGNHSSGKQGIALAQAALDRGAEVTFISANIDLPIPAVQRLIRVASVSDLGNALQLAFNTADAIIMPAAVSDYRLAQPFEGKLHRSETPELELRLVSNPDLLSELSQKRSSAKAPILVGFAAEISDEDDSQSLETLAKKKLMGKSVDMVVANWVSRGLVFGQDDTEVLIVTGSTTTKSAGSKYDVANSVLDSLYTLLQGE
jgi:phosphopantothenoylcysteine decarboxylase/phosphopantothenate--cysteine ligase